jgi:serine/threonine-protein kinase RsbW
MTPGEQAAFVEGGSFPIGLFASAEPELTELPFPAGAKLVLFSDGLLEPEQGGCLELEELAGICARHRSDGAGHLAEALQQEARARISGLPEDDISILVIEAAAEGGEPILQLTVAASLEAVRTASRTLEARLADLGADDGAVADLNLAFVEAANNVVVHGGGDAAMQLSVVVEPGMLRMELIDAGAAIPEAVLSADAPDDPLAESGRGLGLIRACVDELTYSSEFGRNRLVLLRRLERAVV